MRSDTLLRWLILNLIINFININLVSLWENQLSGVLTSLLLEFLESDPFIYRLHINATYFRYIDDILIFLPQNIKIKNITEKLNNTELSINFTHEKESNNTIPFYDILLIKSQNNLTFKVYRQPINKKGLYTFLLSSPQQN